MSVSTEVNAISSTCHFSSSFFLHTHSLLLDSSWRALSLARSLARTLSFPLSLCLVLLLSISLCLPLSQNEKFAKPSPSHAICFQLSLDLPSYYFVYRAAALALKKCRTPVIGALSIYWTRERGREIERKKESLRARDKRERKRRRKGREGGRERTHSAYTHSLFECVSAALFQVITPILGNRREGGCWFRPQHAG